VRGHRQKPAVSFKPLKNRGETVTDIQGPYEGVQGNHQKEEWGGKMEKTGLRFSPRPANVGRGTNGPDRKEGKPRRPARQPWPKKKPTSGARKLRSPKGVRKKGREGKKNWGRQTVKERQPTKKGERLEPLSDIPLM